MAYIHSQKLTIELYNFIKIEYITIKAKIKQKPSLLAKQATPSVSGGCGLWSIFPVSPVEELRVYTTSVYDLMPILPVSLVGDVSIT